MTKTNNIAIRLFIVLPSLNRNYLSDNCLQMSGPAAGGRISDDFRLPPLRLSIYRIRPMTAKPTFDRISARASLKLS
jgi:hypothetical protein